MKSSVCVVLLLSIFATVSFAAVARGTFNDPKHPGKCTIKEDLILSPGEQIKNPDQACGRIMCGENGEATFHTCGVQRVQGCKLGDYIDKSLPYPDCCRRKFICN